MDTTFILIDPIKTEETNPLPDDTGGPLEDLGVTGSAYELMQICSTCMSTSDVRPLPRSACDWLTAVTRGRGVACGVCALCWPVLRRSLKFADFARTSQKELLELVSRNELNLANIRELNASTKRQPFIKLSTKRFCFGPNDDSFLYGDPNTDTVKLETNIDEEAQEYHDNDNTFDENYSGSDNEPIIRKVDTNFPSNVKESKISLENLPAFSDDNDDNNYNDDSNHDDDFKFDNYQSEEEVISTKVTTVKKKAYKKTKKSDILKNTDFSSGEESMASKPEKNIKKKAKKPTKANAKLSDNSNSDDSEIDKFMKKLRNDNVTQPVLDNSKTAEISRLVAKRIRKEPIKKPDDPIVVKHFEIKPFTVEEQKRDMLNKKLVPEYENSMFKCETCYQGFGQEYEYENHVKEHPKDGLTCRVCLKHCTTKAGFTIHVRSHLDRWIFSCKRCKFTTKQGINTAKLHAAIHEGKIHECNICGKVFGRRPTYLSHMRLVHPSDHVCVLCGYSFVGERGIFCHRNLKHKGEDPTVGPESPLCALCDIRFKTAEALATHERVSRRHGGKAYNQASKGKGSGRAGRPAADPAAPPCDYRARQREPPIPCEQCGQEFRGARAYRFHFARAHPTAARTVFFEKTELSLCTVCGMSVSNLYNHMAQHTDGSFRCGTCDKTFKTKVSLNFHKAVHRAPQHQCPTCGKRFNQRANLNRHFTYTHTSIRDVKCLYCDKYYKSVAEMKNHVNYVHLKKPWPKKNADKSVTRKRRKRDSDSDSMDAFAGC